MKDNVGRTENDHFKEVFESIDAPRKQYLAKMDEYIEDIKPSAPLSCGQCIFYKDGVRDEYDEVCAVCTYEPSDEPYICKYKVIDGINSSKERVPWCHYNEN